MYLSRVGVSIAVGATVAIVPLSTAAAAGIDNLVPTASYRPTCVNHGASPPSSAEVCQTDNATVTIYYQSSVRSASVNAVGTSLGDDYQPTVLSISAVSSAVYTGTAETDIIYSQGTIPAGLDGYTWCNDTGSQNDCDQQYVRFKSGLDVDQFLACHESGHAFGLTHFGQASASETNPDPVASTNSQLGCMSRGSGSSHSSTRGKEQINNVY